MQKMRRNNLNFQPGQANFSRAVCVLRAGGGPWAVTWPWENETRAGRGQEMEILEFVGREKQAGKAPEVLRDFLLFSHENLSAGLWISLPSWWIFQWKRLVFVRFVNNTTWDEPEGKNLCKSTLINELSFFTSWLRTNTAHFHFFCCWRFVFYFLNPVTGMDLGFVIWYFCQQVTEAQRTEGKVSTLEQPPSEFIFDFLSSLSHFFLCYCHN